MVFKFVFFYQNKKSTGSGINSISNQKLSDELHKPFIRKFKRRKVYS